MKVDLQNRVGRIGGALLTGASALALVIASPAVAQTSAPADTADDGSDIIVTATPITKAVLGAVNIKRNSDTVVDALTAEDVGALPDKSITETIQRLPGVSISRFAAITDPDHVSEEGQSPYVRGLPYVSTLFNGRDAFSAKNYGRNLDLQDIPPDLVSTLSVYKQQTADQVEGGIAGLVDIVTRKPLDSRKDFIVLNADVNYGNLAKKATPEVSGGFSKQWDVGAGRIGILATGSYARINERVDNARITTYRDFRAAGNGKPASNAGPLTTVNADGTGLANYGTPGTDYYVPIGGGYSRQDTDRRRYGYSGAIEWQANDGSSDLILQYIGTNTSQLYGERTIAPVEDTGNPSLINGSAVAFNSSNVLTKGLLGSADGAGLATQQLSRGRDIRSTTDDFSGHFKLQATERLRFDLDAQYSKASSSTLDASIVAVNEENFLVDNSNGAPSTIFQRPVQYIKGDGSKVLRSSVSSSTNPIGDPATTFWRSAQDHQDNTKGDEYAFRFDTEYKPSDEGFLRKVRFGARYADRRQTIRSDGYNWGNLTERWLGNYATAAQLAGATGSNTGVSSTGSFFNGSGPNLQYLGFNGNPAENYAALVSTAGAIRNASPGPSWASNGFTNDSRFCGNALFFCPLGNQARNGFAPPVTSTSSTAYGGQSGLTTYGPIDGFHNPAEVSKSREETASAFARADFAVDDAGPFGVIDGNIGVRYVETRTESSGYRVVPSAASLFNITDASALATRCPTYVRPNPGGQTNYNICTTYNSGAAGQALATQIVNFFGNGTSQFVTTRNNYNHWLPSFNLRIRPNDQWQFRFAYFRGISRPSFAETRSFTQFQPVSASGQFPTDRAFPTNFAAATANGNPLLVPTEADNFDMTAEYYYSKSGSLTLNVYYKDLTNIFNVYNGQAPTNGVGILQDANGNVLPNGSLPYTSNGVTTLAAVGAPRNNPDHVKLRGFEISWAQANFGDFVPALEGFGATANYTFNDVDPLSQQPVRAANYDTSLGGQAQYFGTFPFPNVSRHNFNASVFFERYGVSARASYTWRSSFFAASFDALGPNDPTYIRAYGGLDGQLGYTINSHFKLVATGSNLLNQKVYNYNQITQGGLQALRSLAEYDRRFTFGGRLNF